MDEDEIMRRATKAVADARKAIAEAEKILARNEQFLRDRGLSVEQLEVFLRRHGGPEVLREIERLAEKAMQEARTDADRAIRELNSADNRARPALRRFRQHI